MPVVPATVNDGQMVVAEIITPPGKRTLPVGRVTEILGEHLAPGMEIEAALGRDLRFAGDSAKSASEGGSP